MEKRKTRLIVNFILIILVFILFTCNNLYAQAQPNNEEVISKLYWGIKKREILDLKSPYITAEKIWVPFGGLNGSTAIIVKPYPIKAMLADDESDRYWADGNKIYYYNPNTKKTDLIYTYSKKIAYYSSVKQSADAQYISFTEYDEKMDEDFFYILNLKTKKIIKVEGKYGIWASIGNRIAYTTSDNSGIYFINADGSKKAKILEGHIIARFYWLDKDSILYLEHIKNGEEFNGIEINIINKNQEIVSVKKFESIDLSGFSFFNDIFVYYEYNPNDKPEIYLYSLNTNEEKLLSYGDFPLLCCSDFSIKGAYLAYGTGHTESVNDLWIINLKTGIKLYLTKYADIFYWLSDNQLLLDEYYPKRAISIITLGDLDKITYYKLNLGKLQGLKRGDIFNVYAKTKINPISGENEGVDESSMRGAIIIVSVNDNDSLAIKYVKNLVDLQKGYIVSNGNVVGKVTGIEESSKKY